MNEALIDNWNSVVGPEDEVFHLGDVALGPWAEWDAVLTRLNGYKILVAGNHDRIFLGNSEKQREKFSPEYARWFDEIYDNNVRNEFAGDTVINLSHFPYDGDSHEADRYSEFRLEDRGTVLLHGHTHSNEKVSYSASNTLQIHVGVDAWNYTPVSEDEVIALIESQRGAEYE